MTTRSRGLAVVLAFLGGLLLSQSIALADLHVTGTTNGSYFDVRGVHSGKWNDLTFVPQGKFIGPGGKIDIAGTISVLEPGVIASLVAMISGVGLWRRISWYGSASIDS